MIAGLTVYIRDTVMATSSSDWCQFIGGFVEVSTFDHFYNRLAELTGFGRENSLRA